MDVLKLNGVKIDGVVAALPEHLIDNREAMASLYSNGVDTLIKATGILSRCIAEEGTTALDLGVAAAKELLKKTGTEPAEIGAVICVTFTPEYRMPADAPAAQFRLGLPKEIPAFDINMACSGYGYGLYVAGAFVNALGKKVLLLDGDVQSVYTSAEDKATVPVLADVGTATLLSPSADVTEWKFAFLSDGSNREALYIPAGGSKRPMQISDMEYKEYEDGSKRRDADIYMDGFEIFKFVAMNASKFIKSFMDNCGEDKDSIDVFVPHQANIYMIGQLTKKLKIDKDKMWKSGDKYGNPASASVPLTIAENGHRWFEEKRNSDTVLISGFGGGLSISCGMISLEKDALYEVIKYSEVKENE